MASIKLSKVVKEYTAGTRAVDEVDLEVRDGEFLVLVGPSGCGKSTLLRMIAGLELITSGSIEIGDVEVSNLDAKDRDIAMVFQNYALYPHMSVRQNIGYGLKVRGMAKRDIAVRVQEVAGMLGIEELLDRRPAHLSGGQRQRVAMGRAIARAPKVYLMDEPLSNLDAKLRVSMRAGLERLHAQLGVTTVYVTHDQVEAMTLGQRAAVLRDGLLQQVDTPQNLYRNPANAFVAAFIGSPSMNFAYAQADQGHVQFGELTLSAPHAPTRGRMLVGIRPEGFSDPRHAGPDAATIEVEVVVREDLGHETLVFFGVDTPRVEIDGAPTTAAAGTLVAEGVTFCARLGAGFDAKVGDKVRLAVAPDALYFFDAETGAALASELLPV